MQELLQQAQQLMAAQQELAESEVTGTAGGGLVTATVNGQGEVTGLSIDPKAIDTGDPSDTAETIADLVLAAIRDAGRAVADLQQTTMGPLAAGLGGGIPGMGAPGEGGMPGLPGFPGMPGDPGLPSGPDAPGSKEIFGPGPGRDQDEDEDGDTGEDRPGNSGA